MKNASQIKTLIIEDNLESQEYFKELITSTFSTISIVGIGDSVLSAIKLINSTQPELIIMDIELKDGLSFEIFDNVKSLDFEVIFVSAHHNLIQKALDHFALCYITKPVENTKLIGAINRYIDLRKRLFNLDKLRLAQNLISNNHSKIFIQTGNTQKLVKVSDIILVEADGNYAYVTLATQERLLASKSLKHYESILPSNTFFKASRFTIINIDFIEFIYKNETIILNNGQHIHVSTRNKTKLQALIKNNS